MTGFRLDVSVVVQLLITVMHAIWMTHTQGLPPARIMVVDGFQR